MERDFTINQVVFNDYASGAVTESNSKNFTVGGMQNVVFKFAGTWTAGSLTIRKREFNTDAWTDVQTVSADERVAITTGTDENYFIIEKSNDFEGEVNCYYSLKKKNS